MKGEGVETGRNSKMLLSDYELIGLGIVCLLDLRITAEYKLSDSRSTLLGLRHCFEDNWMLKYHLAQIYTNASYMGDVMYIVAGTKYTSTTQIMKLDWTLGSY